MSSRRTRRLLTLALLAQLGAGCISRPEALGLAKKVDGPSLADAEGVLVFLHGYGGDIGRSDWFVERARAAGLPPDIAIVRVEAPIAVVPSGRAWWKSSLEERSQTGLRLSRELDALRAAAPRAVGRFYVAGFSQGGTMALAQAPRADYVFALSGCQLTAPERVAGRIYLAHGRRDRICPFPETTRLVRQLEAARVPVELDAFDDDHVVPDAVFAAIVARVHAAAPR